MDELAQPAQTIAGLLQAFISSGGLRLRFRVTLRVSKAKGAASILTDSTPAASEQVPPAEGRRDLSVEFTGPDTELLTARSGELLNALEHIAAKVLRLEPEEHDRVSFDANGFKAERDRWLRESAVAAVERVRASGRPHAFPTMTSRERRMLHIVLRDFGLPTASSGEGRGRFVVLYPESPAATEPEVPNPAGPRRDAIRVREAFRHR